MCRSALTIRSAFRELTGFGSKNGKSVDDSSLVVPDMPPFIAIPESASLPGRFTAQPVWMIRHTHASKQILRLQLVRIMLGSGNLTGASLVGTQLLPGLLGGKFQKIDIHAARLGYCRGAGNNHRHWPSFLT